VSHEKNTIQPSDLSTFIASRRSTRDFLPTAVDQKIIDQILQDSLTAPSWSNTRPFKVAVAQGDVRDRISAEFLSRWGVLSKIMRKGFINKFYLLSTTRRSGLGKQVFEALCNIYNSTKEIRLQVNRQNYKAINFYFKMGFVIEACADFDIGDGYFMNDFIMVKHL
jgi:nitroreductase